MITALCLSTVDLHLEALKAVRLFRSPWANGPSAEGDPLITIQYKYTRRNVELALIIDCGIQGWPPKLDSFLNS